MKTFTENEIRQIKELKSQNICVRKIASQLKLPHRHIIQLLNQLGMPVGVTKGNFRQLTEKDINDIIQEYVSMGISPIKIARKYHIWVPNLVKLLKSRGIEIRANKHCPESEGIIKQMWLYSGLSITQIQEKLNITGKVISRICRNVNRINPKSDQITDQQNELINNSVTKFLEINKMSHRIQDADPSLVNKIQDLYQNTNLYWFQIIKECNVGFDFYKKYTRDLVRNNPPSDDLRDIYIAKYGKELAEIKLKETHKKRSDKSSGQNNPMYGKPSPQRSGNGWKGWYNDFYFRSLREVSYILYLEENKIPYITAEAKQLTIPYIFNDKERTYRADFLINNNELVEIKPKRLHTTPNIVAKRLAAEKFCKIMGLKYSLIDFPINSNRIYEKYKMGIIKFDRNYEERFLNYLSTSRKK